MDFVTVKCEETSEDDLIDIKKEHLPVLNYDVEKIEVHKEEVEYEDKAKLDFSAGEFEYLNIKVEKRSTEALVINVLKTKKEEADNTQNLSHIISGMDHDVMFTGDSSGEENYYPGSAQPETTYRYITSSPTPLVAFSLVSGLTPNQQQLNHSSGPILQSSGVLMNDPTLPSRHCEPKRKEACSKDPSVLCMEPVELIAKLLCEPVPQTVPESRPLCPIDACMQFLGSVLKDFRSEELKLEAMMNLVQTVINAKTVDMLRTQRED